jgi:hypothetical protein
MLQCEKHNLLRESLIVDVLNVFPYFTQLSISDQLHLLLSESIIMPRVGKKYIFLKIGIINGPFQG